jgi:hypothetical protein
MTPRMTLSCISTINISWRSIWYIHGEHKSSALARKLAGVTWCGCLGTDLYLHHSILNRLDCSTGSLAFYPGKNVEPCICESCGAEYTIYLEGKTDEEEALKITVTRYHNLNKDSSDCVLSADSGERHHGGGLTRWTAGVMALWHKVVSKAQDWLRSL